MSIFIDTNVPMYAAGRPHPLREPARAALGAIAAGKLAARTDSEVQQEILYRYYAVHEMQKGMRIFDAYCDLMRGWILPVTEADVRTARTLLAAHPALSARDIIHLAVMQTAGISRILTADRGYQSVHGVEAIALADWRL
ncbi:MAG: type II toxin-antitoxin system VapC family toxin [Sulfobacillus sp.]